MKCPSKRRISTTIQYGTSEYPPLSAWHVRMELCSVSAVPVSLCVSSSCSTKLSQDDDVKDDAPGN